MDSIITQPRINRFLTMCDRKHMRRCSMLIKIISHWRHATQRRRCVHISIRRDQEENYRSQMQWHIFNPGICRNCEFHASLVLPSRPCFKKQNKPVYTCIIFHYLCNKLTKLESYDSASDSSLGQKFKMGLLKFLTAFHTHGMSF